MLLTRELLGGFVATRKRQHRGAARERDINARCE
jgi:hypothetical protein